jgi:hypothetical protein
MEFCRKHLSSHSFKKVVIYIPSKKYFDKFVEECTNIINKGTTVLYLLNRKSSLQMIHTVIHEMASSQQNILCFLSPFFEGLPLFQNIDIIIDTGISFSYSNYSTVEMRCTNKYTLFQKQNIVLNPYSIQSYFLLISETTYHKLSQANAALPPDVIYIYLQCKYHNIPISSTLTKKEIEQSHRRLYELNIRPETLYSVDTYHLLYNVESIPLNIISIIRFLHRNHYLYHDHSFLLLVSIMTIFIFQKNEGPPFDLSSHTSHLLSCSLIRNEFSSELEELFLWVTLFLNFFIVPNHIDFCTYFFLDYYKLCQFKDMIFYLFNTWIHTIHSMPMNFLVPSEKKDSKIMYFIHPDFKEKIRTFFYKQSQFEIIPLNNMNIGSCFYSIHYKNITNPHLKKTFLHKDCAPRFIINLLHKKENFHWRNYEKSVISLFVFTPLYHLKLFQQLKIHIVSFLEKRKQNQETRRKFHVSVVQYFQKVISKAPYMVNDMILSSS